MVGKFVAVTVGHFVAHNRIMVVPFDAKLAVWWGIAIDFDGLFLFNHRKRATGDVSCITGAIEAATNLPAIHLLF